MGPPLRFRVMRHLTGSVIIERMFCFVKLTFSRRSSILIVRTYDRIRSCSVGARQVREWVLLQKNLLSDLPRPYINLPRPR